jgi:dihydroxy-acid dehydratase
MACLSEALGIAPLGSACAPANSSQRLRVGELIGKLAATSLPRPSEILTKKSFENAITLLQALGGSTNAVVHLLAVAGRMPHVEVTLDGETHVADDTELDADVVSDFDRIGRKTPLLVDLKPSGQNYMEDLHKVSHTVGSALTEQRRAEYLASCARLHRCSTWTRRR